MLVINVCDNIIGVSTGVGGPKAHTFSKVRIYSTNFCILLIGFNVNDRDNSLLILFPVVCAFHKA